MSESHKSGSLKYKYVNLTAVSTNNDVVVKR